MTIRFTDPQLVTLSTASQREDCCIAPTPHLRGAVAAKFVEKLLAAGLAVEIPSAKDMPVWRREESGGAIALQLTEAGLAAIGVADESTPAPNDAAETAVSASVAADEKAGGGDSAPGALETRSGLTSNHNAPEDAGARRRRSTRRTKLRTGERALEVCGKRQCSAVWNQAGNADRDPDAS